MFDIYTDGGCSGNPGPGGWAFICGAEKRSGAEKETTNNRMELTAVIQALVWAASAHPPPLRVFTDSQYVKQGITEWIHTGQKNGWKTKDKKPVKNQDLWRELDALAGSLDLRWEWVRGHAGNPWNERCDRMTGEAIAEINK